MRRIVRENAACALVALSACAVLAYLGLQSYAWSDYEREVAPALAALVHGHFGEFLKMAPAYGGSLVERAPFALLPSLWGGGALAVYRAVAVPCVLAAAALGVWLNARMRRQGRPWSARALALIVCVANPLALRALEFGHPEELLGACLCVAAVMLAADERPLWAGLALGLAIANKEWALLAAGPTLLALAPGRARAACLLLAGAVAAAVLAPLALVHSGGFVAATRASATPPGQIFQPWQLWWFFGDPATGAAHATAEAGARVGPAWTSTLSHPLIVVLAALVSVALWWRERRDGRTPARTALLALALLLLERCVLDTWDTGYYIVPFLLALLAWEVGGPVRRVHLLALSCTALATLSYVWLPEHTSLDVQAAAFLAWTLPLGAWLALRLLAPAWLARLRPPRIYAGRAQETTVSALSRPLRASQ